MSPCRYPADRFVLFSSIYGLLGSRELTHYAAANAFQDGLASMRRSLGLPGLAVAWGPWQGAGMAHRFGDGFRTSLEASGLRFVGLEAGFSTLAALATTNRANAAVFPMDWPKYASARRAPHPLAYKLTPMSEGPPTGLGEALAAAPPAAREALLIDALRDHLAETGLLEGAVVDADAALASVGVGSSGAVGLAVFLSEGLGRDFEPTLAYERAERKSYPSVLFCDDTSRGRHSVSPTLQESTATVLVPPKIGSPPQVRARHATRRLSVRPRDAF